MSDVFISPADSIIAVAAKTAPLPAPTPSNRRGDKKQWSFESVTPCAFKPMHIWAVQVLEGHHVEGTREFVKATKTSTRVVYMKMNEKGTLENVFPYAGGSNDE